MSEFFLLLVKIVITVGILVMAWGIGSRFINYLGLDRASNLLIVALALAILGVVFEPIFGGWAFLPLEGFIVLVAVVLVQEYYRAVIKPNPRKWIKSAVGALFVTAFGLLVMVAVVDILSGESSLISQGIKSVLLTVVNTVFDTQ